MQVSRTHALICRACGAPCEDPTDAASTKCRHCGAAVALDEATRRHLARVRRADARLRIVLRQHIWAQLMPVVRRRALITTALAFALAFVLGVVPLALLFLLAINDGIGEGGVLVLAALSMCGMTAALLGPLAAGFWASIRLGRRVPALARQAALRGRTTAAAKCRQCGGFAAVVVVGDGGALPCPFCRAALVGQGADEHALAADALLALHQETGERMLAQAMAGSRSAPPRSESEIEIEIETTLSEIVDIPMLKSKAASATVRQCMRERVWALALPETIDWHRSRWTVAL